MLMCSLLPGAAFTQGWTLKQCIDTAIQNNLTILESDLNVKSNAIALDQSKWNRYPTLNSSLAQNLNLGRSVDPTSYQVSTKASAAGTFSLTSGVTLYNGGQLRNAIVQNQWNLDASGFDLQKAKDDISLAVVNAFVQMIYAREALQNARLQIQTTQAQIDFLQVFVNAGKRAESDVYQLRAQLSTDRYNFSVAEGQVRNARLSLLQLMEVPYDGQFDVQSPVLPDNILVDIPTASAVFESALQTQPIIKSNAGKIRSAEAGWRIAQGALLPKVSLGAGLGTSYSTARKLSSQYQQGSVQPIGYLKSNPDEIVLGNVSQSLISTQSYPIYNQVADNINPSLSITVAVPIFNNYQARNNIRKQEIALTAATITDRIARNTLRKSVEQAYIDLINARSKYNAARETLTAEDIAFQNLKVKFEADKTTTTDLLIEQNKFFQTQSQLLQARYDFVLKLKVLDFYQGKTLQF